MTKNKDEKEVKTCKKCRKMMSIPASIYRWKCPDCGTWNENSKKVLGLETSNKSLASRKPTINNLEEAITAYKAVVKSEENTERLRNSLTIAVRNLSEAEYKTYKKETQTESEQK